MAFNKTKSLEVQVIYALFGNQAWTGGPLEVHLFTAIPDEAYNVSPFPDGATEVTGGSYIAVPIAFDDGPLSDGNDGFYVTHLSPVTFPTATDSWGTVVAFGIFDTLNNIYLYVSPVDTPQLVDNGDVVEFAPGSIVITEK